MRHDEDQPLTDYIAEHPRRVIIGSALILAFTLGLPFVQAALHDEEKYGDYWRGCATDSQCLNVCERDTGRPCTDEDLFGPGEEDDDARPDETLSLAGCR